MTFETCQSVLVQIRSNQKTQTPRVRVDFGGAVFKGRVKRSDSDTGSRQKSSPHGLLILEGLGLTREPETILQIADIPEGGIRPLDE